MRVSRRRRVVNETERRSAGVGCTDGEREALRELAALCDAVKTLREERDPDAVLRAVVALYDRETFARAFHERAVHDLAGGPRVTCR